MLQLGETEWSSRISAMRQTTSPILCNVHLSKAANPRGWRYNLYRYVSTSWTTLKLSTCDPQYTKTSNPWYNIQSFLQPNEQRMQKHHPTWSSRNNKNHVIGFGYHHCHGTYCSASSKGIQPSQFWKLWDACLPDTRVGGPPRKHFSTIMKCSKKEFLWFKQITAASRYDTDGRVYSIQRQSSLQSSSWFKV